MTIWLAYETDRVCRKKCSLISSLKPKETVQSLDLFRN